MKAPFRMVVADDDPKDLELLHKALHLSGSGFEVRELRDGTELIEYLQAASKFTDPEIYPIPDLIVLDLKMPLFSGFDVLRWMRGHPEYGKIPTVVLSGSGLEKDVDSAYLLGANTYFEKPNSFKQLSRLLEVLIEYWSMSKRPYHVHVAAA